MAVGLLAGFTAGMFGVGGGLIVVPALAMVAGFSHKLATGTSLAAIVPIAITGVVGYATGDEVDWQAALWVSLGAVVGAVVGTRLLVRLRTPWLQLAFALLMAATAVRLFVGDAEGAGRGSVSVATALALVLLGVVSGVVAGLFGVGGGLIVVPALSVLFGVPHVLAKGTSLAVIVPTATVGTVRNHRNGLTDLGAAVTVGASGVVSAWIASQVSLGLDPDLAQALFGLLVLATAVQVGRQGLKGRRADRAPARAAAGALGDRDDADDPDDLSPPP